MKKNNVEKILSLVISLSLIICSISVPSFADDTVTFDAVNPSSATFLTVDDFQSNSDEFSSVLFNNVYNLNGGKVQTVKFGKNSGKDVNWDIAGYEEVEGTPTLVLCSKGSLGNTYFGSDSTNDDYATSKIQSELNSIAKSTVAWNVNNTNFISESQKSRIQPVNVNYQYDGATKTSYNNYLYLADGVYGNKYITVGQNDELKISNKNASTKAVGGLLYPGGVAKYYCLRSNYTIKNFAECVLIYIILLSDSYDMTSSSSNGVTWGYVISDHIGCVIPAFNLNLKSVAFASSAPAGTTSTSFSSGNTMTFRFDSAKDENGSKCTDKIATTAEFDSEQIRVNYDKSDGSDLYLYVQGNDGSSDFCYSTPITAVKKITASNVKSGLTDLTNCKIWLEKKIDGVDYAKMIKKTTFKPARIEYTDYKEAFTFSQARSDVVIGSMSDFNFTGDVKYTAGVYDGESDSANPVTDKGISVSVSGNKFLVSVANNTPTGDYYIKISGTDTIDTIKYCTKVTVNKIKLAVPKPNEDIVYNGENQTGVPATTGITLSGDYYATNVGEYTATAKLKNKVNYVWDDKENTTDDKEIKWEIKPKDVTITAKNKNGYVNEDAPVLGNVKDVDYTVEGLLNVDILESEPTLSYKTTPDMSKTGSTEITVSGGSAGENYKIVYKSGYLLVTAKPAQTLEFNSSEVEKTYGDSNFTITATHSVGNGTVTYKSSDENIATVNSSTGEVKIKKAGTTDISATASATSTYGKTTVKYKLTVKKGDLNLSESGLKSGLSVNEITYGDKLSDGVFSGGSSLGTYAWKNPDYTPNAGAESYGVVFTPNDENYNTKEFNFSVKVNKLTPTSVGKEEGYVVDYAQETVVAETGYEISTSNKSLVPLTDNKFELGKKYYVRKTADINYNASDWFEFTVLSLDYGVETTEITYGDKLSESKISGGRTGGEYSWKNGNLIPDAGTKKYTALYIPYVGNPVECEIQVTVNKASNEIPAKDEGYSVDYSNNFIIAGSGYEVSSSKEKYSPLHNNMFVPGQKYYVRKAEDVNHLASEWTEFSLYSIILSGDVVDGVLKLNADGGKFYAPEYTEEYLDEMGATKIDLNGHSVNCISGKSLDKQISSGKIINVTAKVNVENSAILMGDIAKIGSIYYSSLKEAINNALNGDTITLLVDTSENVTLSEGKTVNFDKNGYKWSGNNSGKGIIKVVEYTVSLYDSSDVNEDGSLKISARLKENYDSLAQAIDEADVGDYIKLLKDVKQSSTGSAILSDSKHAILSGVYSDGIFVNALKDFTLDLNGYSLYGNLYVNGSVTIVDSSTTYDDVKKKINIGTGTIAGNLYKLSGGEIVIKSGIINLNEKSEDTLEIIKAMLQKDKNGKTLSSAYLINDKWVVLPEGMNLNFSLEYKVFTKNATNDDFCNPDTSDKLVRSVDNDNINDLAWGKEYQAVVYLNTEMDNITLRAFEFTAKYNQDCISVNIVRNNEINKYGFINEITKGELKYALATNSYTLNSTKCNPVATFNFIVNGDDIRINDIINFSFKKDAYVGTMDTVNNISVNETKEYTASMMNLYDGVKIVDYIYAPEGYKLAIIADEHEENQTINLNDDTELFYTKNKAYISQSTNPYGKNIRGESNTLKGVYLAFVKESVSESTLLKQIITLAGKDNLISDEDYTGDIDRNNKIEINDASLVYQMLAGKSHWGYNPENSNTYIPAYERIISEANHDGKLYGTIGDVNKILNMISK